MAEALCRRRAAERGLAVEVGSAGLFPGDALSEDARLALEEVGLALDHTPAAVTPDRLADADLIVAMSERHAHIPTAGASTTTATVGMRSSR